jgi:predicted outer membrane repeat protein
MKPNVIFNSLITAALLFVASITGLAATLTVTNLNDSGSGSLRQTILNANSGDTINFSVTGTITLTSGQMFITKNLTISGPGPASLTVARSSAGGTPNFRIFYNQSGVTTTISGLTLSNGFLVAHGGAIYNDAESGNATLTIKNCIITGNTGDYGGAIFNDGASSGAGTASLTVINSTISNNTGSQYGGGIWSETGGSGGATVLTVTNCTFSQNTATHSAGAIQHDGFSGTATGTISNCTFSQNSAGNYGGAIDVDGSGGFNLNGSAVLTVTNCTFDRNSANWGGGIAMDGSNGNGSTGNATVTVTNCTFSGNSATTLGGGIYLSETGGGTTALQIGNTIVKTGASGANFAIETFSGGTVSFTSQGNNLSSDDAGGGAGTGPGGHLNHVGDKRNTDPLFDTLGLQNNGGPTQTIGLQSTSPAINAGNNANAPGRDQRYYLRSGVSDIGAFEFGGTLAPVISVSPKNHGAAGPFGIDLPLTGNVGIESRSGGATGDHKLVATFATPVTVNGSPQAQVTSGTGQIGTGGSSNGGVVTLDQTKTVVTMPVTNVTNAQKIVVTLFSVSDGVHTNNATIPMGVLLADVDGSARVDSTDVFQVRQQSLQNANSSNFKRDVDLSGRIDSTDVFITRQQSLTSLPQGPQSAPGGQSRGGLDKNGGKSVQFGDGH